MKNHDYDFGFGASKIISMLSAAASRLIVPSVDS
jgi:hypothetical protein